MDGWMVHLRKLGGSLWMDGWMDGALKKIGWFFMDGWMDGWCTGEWERSHGPNSVAN